MFLGHSDNTLLNINSAQIAFSLVNILGMLFIIGSMNAFDSIGSVSYIHADFEMFHEIYNNAKLFNLLVYLIIFLPMCFISNYLLYFANYSAEDIYNASLLIKILLIPNFLNILMTLNTKVLQIMGKYTLVMILYVVALIVHILACTIFIYALKMGIIGAGISFIFSALVLYILTVYFLYTECPPFRGKSIMAVDTANLNSSSKIYYYSRSAISSGSLYFMSELNFQLIIFLSYYLGQSSFTANSILENYMTLYYYVLIGITTPICQKVNGLLINQNIKSYINFAKASFLLAFIIASVISLVNFIMKYHICYMYVDNEEVCEKFNHIIDLYCVFIFVDWASVILNSILKGINAHIKINIVMSLFILFIFLPIGILLAFTFKYDYAGFWYACFLSMIFFLISQSIYLKGKDMKKESNKIIKSLKKNNYQNEIIFK
jgi:Na+-driven multidrug efflux pump